MLHDVIKQLEMLTLPQIMQAYLGTQSNFSVDMREKTQRILCQLFDINPILVSKNINKMSMDLALERSLIDLTK